VKDAWGAGAFDALIEARRRDLGARAFATWAELEAYIDATAGEVMRLAAIACGGVIDETLLRAASRAWGYAAWFRSGRRPPVGEQPSALLNRARSAHDALKGVAVPQVLFPALGYAALAPAYLRAFTAKQAAPPLLMRQVRLVGASLTGRLG
jgi:phytoene synthase